MNFSPYPLCYQQFERIAFSSSTTLTTKHLRDHVLKPRIKRTIIGSIRGHSGPYSTPCPGALRPRGAVDSHRCGPDSYPLACRLNVGLLDRLVSGMCAWAVAYLDRIFALPWCR
jgi:hypothetical protein